MSKLLDGLNENQVRAVEKINGPLLVVAGAGSGKTRALTHRIAHMIQDHGVSPWNILAVTFTNKAAKEMKERLVKLLANQDEVALMEGFGDLLSAADLEQLVGRNNLPTVGTFHSICVRILRKNIHMLDYENVFAIYDTTDQQILIKRVMEDMMINPKKVNPKAVLSHISNAKNQLITPREYSSYANDYFSERVAEVYPVYQRNLERNNALDFDDIIMKTVQLFDQYPEVLNAYQEKFKYISVDEYQDTNKAQYVLINQLAAKYRNLCVIGDADQSIYGWRGANIQNILDFEKDYPEALTVVLEQNYRSTQNILDASNHIIKKNTQRRSKELWTDKGEGSILRHWLADNERHEGDLIAREILKLLESMEHKNYSKFVVLYRTNAQSRVMEEVFMRHGVPYKIVGGIKFYSRKEIKDILAYLRVIQNPSDTVSLFRIINTPSRKLGAKTIERIREFASQHGISVFKAMAIADQIEGIPTSKAVVIMNFIELMLSLQNRNKSNSASAMIKYVVEETGYKKMLNDGSVEGEARLENINELASVAHKYDNIEAGVSLSIFMEEVGLISDLDRIEEEDNAVTLMTIHSAKGLEFPYVFIAGLEEGIFPHNRSLMDRVQLEEERRLMYVAMTRAMEGLYLLHARTRMLYGESKSNAPSQFLADIPEELIESNTRMRPKAPTMDVSNFGTKPIPVEFAAEVECEFGVGDTAAHPTFGNGIVVDITGGIITIAFKDPTIGVKKLAISIAPLKKV